MCSMNMKSSLTISRRNQTHLYMQCAHVCVCVCKNVLHVCVCVCVCVFAHMSVCVCLCVSMVTSLKKKFYKLNKVSG